MFIKSGLKEWSAVVDALGTGTQTIIVRTYQPGDKTFLLYPTFSFYANNASRPENFEKFIQPMHIEAACRSGRETTDLARIEYLVKISYFATVTDTLELTKPSQIDALENFSIWTKEHLHTYAASAKSKKCYVWLLRVYELPEPFTVGRIAQGGPPNYYVPPRAIQVDEPLPVLKDDDYNKTAQSLQSFLTATKPASSKSAH